MLLLDHSREKEFADLLDRLTDPGGDTAALARRLIEIDPWFAPAYARIAYESIESKDYDQAEQ